MLSGYLKPLGTNSRSKGLQIGFVDGLKIATFVCWLRLNRSKAVLGSDTTHICSDHGFSDADFSRDLSVSEFLFSIGESMRL